MKKLPIMLLILFIFNHLSYATEKKDLVGIWADENNNYFSISVNGDYLLFIDLSRSTPRAQALIDAGIEPKPEYLTYFGKGMDSSADFVTPIVPYVDLEAKFPGIKNIINTSLTFYAEDGTPLEYYPREFYGTDGNPLSNYRYIYTPIMVSNPICIGEVSCGPGNASEFTIILNKVF